MLRSIGGIHGSVLLLGLCALAWGVWGVGCSPAPPGPPLLHEMPAFAGEIDVAAPDAPQATRYELSFARSNGYFSMKVGSGAAVVTLLHDRNGPRAARPPAQQVLAFANNEPRDATPAEREQFALVRALIDPRQIEAVDRGAAKYSVRIGGARFSVHVLPKPPGVHGGGAPPPGSDRDK